VPLNRQYLDSLQGLDDEATMRETREETEQRLAVVEDSLQLYDNPLFDTFRGLMRSEEARTLNEMLNCSPEEVLQKRERLRTLRYLQGHEQKLRDERARLVQRLEEEET
jgi:hypothetical protein